MKTKNILKVGLVAMAFLGFSGLAHAATYAYVNQAGDVNAVIANDPYEAMRIAPSIDEHSGVMLLSSPADVILDQHVSVS